MTEKTMALPRTAAVRSFGDGMDNLAKAVLFRKLAELRHGTLILVDGQEITLFGAGDPKVRFIVRRPRAYARAAFGGSIGVGESYADGDWDSDDLPALAKFFVENRETLTSLD